jgi:hypothetical protein
MKSLTKKEIQQELKRLGINTPSEIKSFLKEYKVYISSQKDLVMELQKSIETNTQGFEG